MMERILKKKQKGFEGDRYATTEEELYEKAIALLDKCKIEADFGKPHRKESDDEREAAA